MPLSSDSLHGFQEDPECAEYCQCGHHKESPCHEGNTVTHSRAAAALTAAYRRAAAAMCAECAKGDVPKWMVAFQGRTHVWKVGNGHTKCSAAAIWDRLIEPPAPKSDSGDIEEVVTVADEAIARRCMEIAERRCRSLNKQAAQEIRAGRPEQASRTELRADQFEWMANQIRKEFL